MGVNVTGIVEHNAGEAARCLDKTALADAMCESRARTLALFDACTAALGPALAVPCAPELNPPLWELGHIGWFQEYRIARNPERAKGRGANPDAQRTPARQAVRAVDADALYNSSTVAHSQLYHMRPVGLLVAVEGGPRLGIEAPHRFLHQRSPCLFRALQRRHQRDGLKRQ